MNGCFLGAFYVINGTLGQKREGGGREEEEKVKQNLLMLQSAGTCVSEKGEKEEERERQGTHQSSHMP